MTQFPRQFLFNKTDVKTYILKKFFFSDKEYKYSPLYKIYQAFYITSTVTSVTISGMYWAKIHNPGIDSYQIF